jgi:hypothetical protein
MDVDLFKIIALISTVIAILDKLYIYVNRSRIHL